MKELNLIERNDYSGHAARRDRKKGLVTGVLYGKRRANFLFEVGEISLASVLSDTGEHAILDVNVEGTQEKVLIKSVQKDPITHKVMHIDLQEIEGSSDVACEIPIIFNNEGYVNSLGAILQKQKNCIKVRCNPNAIPKCIEVDFKNYKVGDVVKVEDLNICGECKVLDNPADVIASINYEHRVDDRDKDDNSEEETQ